MRSSVYPILIILTALFLSGLPVQAAIVEVPDTAKIYHHAFQTNPMGLFSLTISGNYEILINQTHGLLIEGAIGFLPASRAKSGGLGYRWHWRKKMESGFLGLFIRYGTFSGKGEDKNSSPPKEFGFSGSIFAVGPNVGKRWIWDSGLSVVVRIGYGYSDFHMEWTGDEFEGMDFTEKFMKYTAGLDGELTLGYAF
jgi:hypothetical protein